MLTSGVHMGRYHNNHNNRSSRMYNKRKVNYQEDGYMSKKQFNTPQRRRTNHNVAMYDGDNRHDNRRSYARSYHKTFPTGNFNDGNGEVDDDSEKSRYNRNRDYVEREMNNNEDYFGEFSYKDRKHDRHSSLQNRYNDDTRVIINPKRSFEIEENVHSLDRGFKNDYERRSSGLDSSQDHSNVRSSRRSLNSVDFENNNTRREFFKDYEENEPNDHQNVRINRDEMSSERDDYENYRNLNEIRTRRSSYDNDASFQKQRIHDDVIYRKSSYDLGKDFSEDYNPITVSSKEVDRMDNPMVSSSSNGVYDRNEKDVLQEYIMSAIKSAEFESDARKGETLKAFMDKLGVTLDEVQKYFDDELARRNDINILQTSLRKLYRDKQLSNFFSAPTENVPAQKISHEVHVPLVTGSSHKESNSGANLHSSVRPQDISLPSHNLSKPKVNLQSQRSRSPRRDHDDESFIPLNNTDETLYHSSTVSRNRSSFPVSLKLCTDVDPNDSYFERRKSSSSVDDIYRNKAPIRIDRLECDDDRYTSMYDRDTSDRGTVRVERNDDIHRERRSLSRSSRSPVRRERISRSEEKSDGNNNRESSLEYSRNGIKEMLMKAGDKSVEEYRRSQTTALAAKFLLSKNALRFDPNYIALASHTVIPYQYAIDNSNQRPQNFSQSFPNANVVPGNSLVSEIKNSSIETSITKNDNIDSISERAACKSSIDSSDLLNVEETLSMLKKASKTSNRSSSNDDAKEKPIVQRKGETNRHSDEEELKITKVVGVKKRSSDHRPVESIVSVVPSSQRKVTIRSDAKKKMNKVIDSAAQQQQSSALNKNKIRVPSWFNSRCIELLKQRHKCGQQLKKAQNDPNASHEHLDSLKESLRDINREYIPFVRKSKSEYEKNNGALKGTNKPVADKDSSSNVSNVEPL